MILPFWVDVRSYMIPRIMLATYVHDDEELHLHEKYNGVKKSYLRIMASIDPGSSGGEGGLRLLLHASPTPTPTGDGVSVKSATKPAGAAASCAKTALSSSGDGMNISGAGTSSQVGPR